MRESLLNISEQCLGDKYLFISKNNEFVPVGEGGSGIVYAANQIFSSDLKACAKRAVKFFAYRDDLIDKLGYVSKDNFDIEIENISRFNHQNILKVIDGNYYNVMISQSKQISIPYTITEFIDGPNLESLFEDTNNDLCTQIFKNEEAVFTLFSQIINGIEYLHKNNFFHCDIAPKNIFIKSDVDGGFLAIIGDLGAGKTTSPQKFEKTRIIGTRNYMPEDARLLKDKDVTYEEFCKLQPRWDIYSTVTSLKEIIENIRKSNLFKFDFWNLDRFYEKISDFNYNRISDILADIERLRPISSQILNLDELSEASKSVNQILLPINSAYLSRRMRKISKHDMLLRLMDVPQLLEGASTFPGANHTRYEHSLGTYELMRKAMLSLLRNKEYAKFFSEKYVIVGLLAALLSSLANYPYSYAISELQLQEPELFSEVTPRKLFNELINHKSNVTNRSLSDCIMELFDGYCLSISDIEYVVFGKGEDILRCRELDVLNHILNSSVGVRVLDYIMRDSHHIGLTYKIDSDNLFKSMSISQGEFCLRQPGIMSAEQIITNRYWLFKRIYWSAPNRANAALLKHIFYTVRGDDFNKNLLCSFHLASKRELQEIIRCSAKKEDVLSINYAIDQLNQKGQTRYRSVLVLDKNSEYPHANEICSTFSAMPYSKQHLIRDKLEQELIKKYKNLENEVNKGAIILVDMPYEKSGNKLGDDIRILRYDNSYLSLANASGIVAGLKTAFDDQLMLLRVFIRPDIHDLLCIDHDIKDIGEFINDVLYELL